MAARTRLRRVLPRVIGHRGAAAVAPENTLAGVKAAHAASAAWVEVDVKLSRDGVPFLLHDPTLKRTTNGKGRARDRTMADLGRLDAGAWFEPAFKGELLPTLEALIGLALDLDLGLNLEIKPCRGREAETARVVAREVGRLWPKDRPHPLLSSFSLLALEALADLDPARPRGLIADRPPRGWRTLAERLGLASLHLGREKLRLDQIEEVRAAGLPLLVWTVNDPIEAEALLAAGAAAVITDDPAALRRLV